MTYRSGDPAATRRILVVGVIHGDEAAGLAVTARRERALAAPGSSVLVVPDLNPDEVAAHRRQNAAGVDLNRNFPFHWTSLGHRGDQQYAGSGPLSEPESRAFATLCRRFRPTVSVWFHQPVGVVDESGGVLVVEQRFARLIGLPLRRLVRYPGSVASWQNNMVAGSSAFVVELPRHPSARLIDRAVTAIRDVETGRR